MTSFVPVCTSKSALLLQRHCRSRDIGAGLDFVMSHDAELLTRLEDASVPTSKLRTRCK
jgi:hypothetical protein